ncbi:hypothetical protein QUB00_18035, partial [Microcoleus sp. F8_C2]
SSTSTLIDIQSEQSARRFIVGWGRVLQIVLCRPVFLVNPPLPQSSTSTLIYIQSEQSARRSIFGWGRVLQIVLCRPVFLVNPPLQVNYRN